MRLGFSASQLEKKSSCCRQVVTSVCWFQGAGHCLPVALLVTMLHTCLAELMVNKPQTVHWSLYSTKLGVLQILSSVCGKRDVFHSRGTQATVSTFWRLSNLFLSTDQLLDTIHAYSCVDLCLHNCLQIIVGKTKEMIVDFCRCQHSPRALVNIWVMDIERVAS